MPPSPAAATYTSPLAVPWSRAAYHRFGLHARRGAGEALCCIVPDGRRGRYDLWVAKRYCGCWKLNSKLSRFAQNKFNPVGILQ